MYNVSTSVVIRTYWGIMSRGPVQTLQHNKSLMHHDSQSQFILMIFFELPLYMTERILNIFHFPLLTIYFDFLESSNLVTNPAN